MNKQFLEQIGKEVAALPEAYIESLAPVLNAAMKELQTALTDSIEAGIEDRFTAQMLRRCLLQCRTAFNTIDKLRPKMVETLIGGSRAAATMSLDHLVRTFERYEEGFNAGLFRIPLQQAARLSHTARIDTFPASVDRYTLAVRRDVKLQLGLGLVRGETLHQMSKRIAPRIAASVDNIGSGLANKYTYWSDRIVRTEVLTAYNEHELEHLKALYKNEPDLLMEWNAANDLRTCVECRSLDGEKAAPGQLFKNMYSNPPAHPMCRCSLLPYMKHWFN